MDIMIILQVIVLFGAIFLGVKLGGMGIGYAGGLGVVVLALVLGMKPGSIPWDVILLCRLSRLSQRCKWQVDLII